MWKINISKIDSELSLSLQQIISQTVKSDGAFLFNNQAEGRDNWTICAFNPILTVNDQQLVFCSRKEMVDPLSFIDLFMAENRAEENFPLLLGYLAYDYKNRLEEEGLFNKKADQRLPLIFFRAYQFYLVKNSQNCYDLYEATPTFEYINSSRPEFNLSDILPQDLGGSEISYTSLNQAEFMDGVEKIRDYIRAGDIYQANLTREIGGKTDLSPAELILNLYHSNKISYGGAISVGENWLISSSPELFFETSQNQIKTSPIKGTIARLADPLADRQNLAELLQDPKELAELAMIVDLLRNDLGKICRYDTISVGNFPEVIELKNVFHLYCDVWGELETTSFKTIMEALFPGGSITGCPKIRACQIIEELESGGRGAYTGSLGRINCDGSMLFNILIRTIFLYQDQTFSFNVGGGITLKSDPYKEFLETNHKAKNLLNALKIRGE